MIPPSPVFRPPRREFLSAAGLCLLLASCSLLGRSEKRARMATAVPSPSDTPLSGPILPLRTDPSPPAEISTPSSILSCPDLHGSLSAVSAPGTITGESVEFRVYLPPCYDSEAGDRYPALFLFHGLGRTPDQWHALGLEDTADRLILSGEIAPLIIVLPYIRGEDSDDAVFLADLLPAADGRFRTLADREHRAIGGVSRGALWALRLALRRADLFGAVGVHSISRSPNALADIYLWAEAVPETIWPRMYFDGGYSDPALPQMQEILRVFDLLQRPYESRIPPGDHSDAYWSEHLREYLLWYAAGWVNANAPAE
jgi:enterochelin esterase-like enzyme